MQKRYFSPWRPIFKTLTLFLELGKGDVMNKRQFFIWSCIFSRYSVDNVISRKTPIGRRKKQWPSFFPLTRTEKENPEKTQFRKLPQWSVRKDTQQNVSTKQTRERSPNNLK